MKVETTNMKKFNKRNELNPTTNLILQTSFVKLSFILQASHHKSVL